MIKYSIEDLVTVAVNEAISNAIKLLIDDISMRKTFQEKLEKEDFSPEKSLIEYERIIFCED